MHEFGITESIVTSLLADLKQKGVESVSEVQFRRGSAFSEDALRQAFGALSAGTILEGAKLSIETVNLVHNCGCGYTQVITSDDLIGHMFVCPQCGLMREIDEAHDLELIGVKTGKSEDAPATR